MFDLAAVKTALEASSPLLQQVILPEGVGSLAVDSAITLVELVGPDMSDRVHPLVLPNEPVYPAAVYELISSETLEIDGYPVLRDDGYLLQVSGPVYGAVRTAAETVRDTLLDYATAGEAGTVSIEDQADKYSDKLFLFETGIALRMTHLALASQVVPAAFVYTYSHDSSPLNRYGDVETEEETRVSVLIVARIPAGGVSALAALLEEVRAVVMAITAAGWKRPLWYGGEIADIHNSLVLWRENFAFPRNREFS